MSTRMPPRGGTPQRPSYRPPAETNENKAPSGPGGRRRAFDIVIFLVVIALVAVFAKEMGSGLAPAADAGPTLNLKTAKPGKGSSTAAPTGTAVPVGDRPLITELMPSNKGAITDEKGDYVDWFEIYNPTGNSINLDGFSVSDNVKKPTKYTLPAYVLDPGKFVIVYADGQPSTNDELHTPFKLKNANAVLMLTDPSGNILQQISYPPLPSDCSYVLDMSTGNWAAAGKDATTGMYKSTPGFPNTDDGFAAFLQTRRAASPVGIDEVMAGNTLTIKDEDGDYSDWVELYNSSDKAVDLTGWGLSKSEIDPKKWVFPSTTINPGQYLVVFCDAKNRAVAGKELHTDFRLNAFQDTVLLSNLRGQIVSEVKINRLNNDESFGQTPGTDQWQTFSHPTPGYPNTEDGWNSFQKTLYAGTGAEPVVINEVMNDNVKTLMDQSGDYPDWIELYNRSNQSVDLKGWGLTNKSNQLGKWQFPDVTLKAGQYLKVFALGAPASGTANTTKSTNSELDADFGLSGTGCIVVLTAPDGSMADRCFVPAMRGGLSYDRQAGNGGFEYSTSPTPGTANAGGDYPGLAPDPVFSEQAGMYDTEQQVALSTPDPQAKIYYTLNGDLPSQNSTPYTGPIDVKKPTAAQFGGTVIRAMAYRDGYLPSNVSTSTYFIGQNFTMPVISISVDNKAMFDPTTGLYEKGPNAYNKYPFKDLNNPKIKANFWKTGKNGEIPAHVEFFDTDNPSELVAISQDCGLQIQGQYSRGDVFKAFELVARSEYGGNSFDYQVFPDEPYSSFKSIISRPGGQDVKTTGMRDMLTISLARETIPNNYDGGPSMFTQDVRLALEFVNGEFWGVTTLHEKISAQTLAQHYPGVDANTVDLLEYNDTVLAGSNKDYDALVTFARTHDLSNPDNYKYVTDRMDIDSFINFMSMEMCTGNTDYGNTREWRSPNLDNKWHWIFYDFCWTFWAPNVKPGNVRSDIANDIAALNKPTAKYNGYLMQALLKNPDFRDEFIKQLAYNTTVTFNTDTMLQKIDEIAAQMQPYMAAEDAKWHDISFEGNNVTGAEGYSNWEGKVDDLRTYAKQHPALLMQEALTYFQSNYGMTEDQVKADLKAGGWSG